MAPVRLTQAANQRTDVDTRFSARRATTRAVQIQNLHRPPARPARLGLREARHAVRKGEHGDAVMRAREEVLDELHDGEAERDQGHGQLEPPRPQEPREPRRRARPRVDQVVRREAKPCRDVPRASGLARPPTPPRTARQTRVAGFAAA